MATLGFAAFTASDGTGISTYTADLGFGAFSAGISASQVFIQGNEVVTSNAGITLAAVSQDLLATDVVEAFMDVRREDADVSGAVFGLSFRRKNSGNTSNGEGLAFLAERVSAANVTLVVRQYNVAGTEIFTSIIATPFAWALSAYKRIGVRLSGSTVVPFVEDFGGGNRQSFTAISLSVPYTAPEYGRYGLITRRHTGQRFDNLTLTDIPVASNPGTAAGGAPQTVNFPRPLPRYDLENENRFRRTLQAALNEVAAKAGTLDLTTTVAAHSHLANQIGGVTVAERTFKESARYTFTDSIDVGGVVYSETSVLPSADNILDVGASGRRLKKLWAVDIDFSGVLTGTVLETQIADGTILARVAANETISGTWTHTAPLLIADGAATTPSVRFTNDPDTGLFLESTNNRLSVTAGGQTRLRVTDGAFQFAGVEVAGVYTVPPSGGAFGVTPTIAFSANGQFARGVRFLGGYTNLGAFTGVTVRGVDFSPQIGSSGTQHFDNVHAFVIGGAAGGTVTYGDWRGLYITDAPTGATGTVKHGIYIDALSGATTNYAIFTNAGLVRLGDKLTVAHNADVLARFERTAAGAAFTEFAANTGADVWQVGVGADNIFRVREDVSDSLILSPGGTLTRGLRVQRYWVESSGFSSLGAIEGTTFHNTVTVAANLVYAGSGDPLAAANWRYINAAGGSSSAATLLMTRTNGGESSADFRFFTAPTSTGAGATPASLTERFRVQGTGSVLVLGSSSLFHAFGNALVVGRMQVGNGSLQDSTATSLDNLIVGQLGSGSAGIVIGSATNGTGTLAFLDDTTTIAARILYAHATDALSFHIGGVSHVTITSDGRLFGGALHNNAGSVAGTTNHYIASGTYTPALTNVANLDASTAYVCQWIRVGNVVTVSGKVDVDPTLTATATQLGISLPIASTLTATNQCGGAAAAPGIAGQSAAVLGDATNDRAEMQWVAGDVTNQAMFFTFTYVIL